MSIIDLDGDGNNNQNEIKSVHEAYQKEFCRLNIEHCKSIEKLEKYYKDEMNLAQFCSSKKLLKTIESLLEANEKYKIENDALNNKIDYIFDTYQSIIIDFEKKQRSFVSQILELKEVTIVFRYYMHYMTCIQEVNL